jgi:hypothetical protein
LESIPRRTIKRIRHLLCALSLGVAACGGGGPTSSSTPLVSGIYTGTAAITHNECTPEDGALEGVRSITVSQPRSNDIDLELPGHGSAGPGDIPIPPRTASGELSFFPTGLFSAESSGVLGAMTVVISMTGSIVGDHLTGAESVTMTTSAETCRVSFSYDMTRES